MAESRKSRRLTKGIGISRDELLSKTGISDGKVFCQTLDALEKCGFVRRYTAFGKKQRDSLYQLIDNEYARKFQNVLSLDSLFAC